MKTGWKPAALFFTLGLILCVPLLLGTMKVMVATSTPEFCSTCHEIEPAVTAWRASTHANNERGLVAKCMDCHLPPPEDTFRFFTMKTYHGLKDVVGHVLDGSEGYDKEASRENMYEEVTNETCMRCHENILYLPYNRGAMRAHRTVLYPRPGLETKCVDCHYDLVHVQRTEFQYSQAREVPYQAKGLRTLPSAQTDS